MSEPCTHPDHDKEWTICADCLARSEAKAHRVVTVYYCALCLTTMGTEAIPSLYPGTASAPHESLCRTCVERGSKYGRIAKPRKLGIISFHQLEIRTPLHSGGLSHSLRNDAPGMAGRSRRTGAGEAAARAKAAAHRLMHRVQNSYGIRQCVFCNLLTHNRFRPLSHSSK